MAYDEQLAERVRVILAERRGVTEKRIMGTLAFMLNGTICCCVESDGLLVRVDVEERERLLAERAVSPKTVGSRTMKGFVRVAREGLRTRAGLSKWVERGIATGAVRRGKTAKRAAR